MKRRIGLAVALFPFTLLLALAGWKCSSPPLHEVARDSIAAASGFLKAAQKNHALECSAVPKCELPTVEDKPKCLRLCNAINRGIDATNLAIGTLNVYCASGEWDKGGPCTPDKNYEAKLREAIKNLDTIISDAKGLVTP